MIATVHGYGAAWLAIWMLFHPYRPLKFLGVTVWPQGMIPRHRERLAHSIGNAVGNELVSQETVLNALFGTSFFQRKVEDFVNAYTADLLATIYPSFIEALPSGARAPILDTISALQFRLAEYIAALLKSEETALAISRFVDRQVVGEIKVTEEDVRRYYDQNPAEVNRKEGVQVTQILVRVSPDADARARAAAREKIEAILKEVKSGGDFADLARKYSEDHEARSTGHTGWIVRGNGPPAIEKTAFALQPGQTSDVIESRLGLHIIKVLQKRAEGPVPYDEAKETIRAKLVARERAGKIRAYVDDLKEQARVERGSKTTS